MYAVKSLFRTRIVSGAGATQHSLIEERIVLYDAATADEAIALAEADAEAYAAAGEHLNIDGDRVITTSLGAYDAYALVEEPGHRREVFSSTFLFAAGDEDDAIVTRLMPPAGEGEQRARMKFLRAAIAKRLVDALSPSHE